MIDSQPAPEPDATHSGLPLSPRGEGSRQPWYRRLRDWLWGYDFFISWDAATGQPRGVPLKHDGSVNAVSFSPDGRTLATVSHDKTARLWDMLPPVPDDPKWVRLAVEVATWKTIDNGLVRTLTQAEWLERKNRPGARGENCLHHTWDELTAAEKLELRTPPTVRSLD